MTRSFDSPAAGFTLIEVLVVLVIFGLFAAAAYSSLDYAMKSRARLEQSFARTTELQRAFVRLRNDLQQLRARSARDGYGEPQGALAVLPDGAVEFTRSGWRNPLGQPRSVLERVAYRLDDDSRLLRVSWRALDRAQDATPSEVVVLEQVEDVRWRFLHGTEWADAWPPAGTAGAATLDEVPRAVELTLTLKDLGAVRLLFSSTNGKAT